MWRHGAICIVLGVLAGCHWEFRDPFDSSAMTYSRLATTLDLRAEQTGPVNPDDVSESEFPLVARRLRQEAALKQVLVGKPVAETKQSLEKRGWTCDVFRPGPAALKDNLTGSLTTGILWCSPPSRQTLNSLKDSLGDPAGLRYVYVKYEDSVVTDVIAE